MHTWRLLLPALFLCLAGTGCADSEPPPAIIRELEAGDTSAETLEVWSDARGELPAPLDTEPVQSSPGECPLEPEEETEGEEEEDGEGEAPGSGTVRVTSSLRDRTKAEDGEEEPWDCPADGPCLFVLKDESFVPVQGEPGAPGEHVFPHVPDGPYYLKDGDNLLVTEAREVDLGFDKLLRDGILDLESDAPVRVRLRGLEPWHDRFSGLREAPPYSDLQLVSEELGFGTSLVLYDMYEGATAADEELQPCVARCFDAERGDRARVVQQAPRELCALPGGGVQRYVTAVRALHLPPFSHDGSEPLDLEGTLQPLPPRELELDWRLSDFTALAADVHPEAVSTTSRFSMRPASPEPATEGWMGFLGELMSLVVAPRGPDRLSGSVVYGNPSPTRTGEVARAATSFAVPVQTPDGLAFHLTASVFVQDRPSKLAGQPLRPRIQPPRALTIDGAEAYRSRTLEVGSHVIGWRHPTGGAPDVYLLRLQRIDLDDPASPFPVPVVQLYVDGSATSVRLPSGYLEPGNHYSLSVEAVVSEGYAAWKRPMQLNDRFVVSRAAAMCGLLSVPAWTS